MVRTPNAEVPNLSGRTLTFIAIGDWGRNGGYGQRPTAATLGAVAQNVSAAFIISVGDNFYDSGVVSEDDPQFNSSWRDVYTHPGLVSLPWFAVAGNHDWRGGAPSLRGQVAYGRDPRWRFPSLNYSATFGFDGAPGGGDVALVFFDTNPFISQYRAAPDNPDMAAALAAAPPPAATLAWLDAQLSAVADTAAAVLVVGHHPVFSGGEHGDSGDLKAVLPPLFERHGVDAYLAGHDHTLIHLSSAGVEYVVTGGGSKVRDNTAVTPETKWFGDVNGFSVHRVNGSHASHHYVHGLTGEVLWGTVVPLRPKGRGRNTTGSR